MEEKTRNTQTEEGKKASVANACVQEKEGKERASSCTLRGAGFDEGLVSLSSHHSSRD